MAGFPYLFWPLLSFLRGVLADNKWIGALLCRNPAWRRRCSGCGLRALLHPAKRIKMIEAYPRARGICMICLGCVNLCPHNAMQLLWRAAYVRPCEPCWPQWVVKSKEQPGIR
jgi:Pyruvate/2-oxoacid:ferredoxin oxidoreductase delta subunit